MGMAVKLSTIFASCALVLLTGCAVIERANRLPVLGLVEDGVYTHPNGVFQCPLPTLKQGFVGEVEIEDASRIVRTVQRVIPVNERRPGDPPLRDEIVYPIKYKPQSVVTFRDASEEKTMLEIGFRPVKASERREDVLKSQYSGGKLRVTF